MVSKILIKKLTTVYQCLQRSQASDASDVKKRRRVEELPSKGGLIEVLADGDPRKSQKPVVEYVCSASILTSRELIVPSIIAVQGLGSNYPLTWTKDDTMWLKDFLPDDLPQARLLAFVYPSSAFVDRDFVDLRALSGSLLRSLVKEREDMYLKVRRCLLRAGSLMSQKL